MWFSKSAEEVLQIFNVNPEQGLSSEKVKEKSAIYGENKLKAKPKKGLVSLFIAQLKDMLIYVLLSAAVITIVIHEYIDALIIILVVILNAVIGVVQEYKAEKAIEALQQMAAPKCLVRRSGVVEEISSEEIVPGDIVVLDAGRLVPADLRLIKSANLQIEESSLTGESVASEKNAHDIYQDPKTPLGDRTNMAFMSTLVTYGHGEGIVVDTAMNTEMGKIARILDEEIEEMTPLQKRMEELGRKLGFIAIVVCVLIFGIAVFQGRDLFETFLTAISLAVAVIPEGLPAIVAIVLALGVTQMSKINAIVRKLTAVETLGSVNIICSDKTGTLTQNKMTVVKLYTLNNLKEIPAVGAFEVKNDEQELVRSLVLCSDATLENGQSTGDPTEVALVVLGERYNLTSKKLNAEYKRVDENSFDSVRKLMSTLNQEGSSYRVHTKGAIDNILKISTNVLINGRVLPLTEEIKTQFSQIADEMSDDALRVLGVAYKDCDNPISAGEMEKDLTIIGLVGMIDPPRPEVKDSIREAKMAGITPVMITGDHKNTAMAIAKNLGIAEFHEQSITGAEIDELIEEEFSKEINNYRVFARVSPEHKVKIVKAYKIQGNIVSMTGDGVNDAPSLKNADIGVAMGITGTDVSKGASDMILTDDNFTTIVHAIEEGRNIYNNIKKSVIYLLSCNLGEMIAILATVLFFWPLPLLPTQILWINLITDSLPAIALGVDPRDKDVMKQKPRDPNESFFAHGAGIRAFLGGVMIGFVTLAAFYFGLKEFNYALSSKDIPENVLTYARTMAFVVLATSQLFYSISIRNSVKTILQIGLFSNMKLIIAIVAGLLLQVALISIPILSSAFKVQILTLNDWYFVFVLALIPLIINELIKVLRRWG
ncbi:cation-translocating P-type ATPase [Phosphitispora sp. TUW77]|uniref:cation-translocating P-type ATPase n=1 Tax=Phosphitispora sp. TUW77 TaxID=3152361 RepID=UPI003AB245B2